MKTEWTIVALITIVASISDAILGIVGLAGILGPSNSLAWTLCFGGGLVLTLMTMSSQVLLSKKSSIFLKLLWMTSMAIDTLTSVVAGVFNGIEGQPIGEPFELSTLRIDANNFVESVVVLGVAFLLAGCTAATISVFDKLKDSNGSDDSPDERRIP